MRRRQQVSSPGQWLQVAIATALIAGLPVAFVWWLRASGAVSSAVFGLVLGVALSLTVSCMACVAWEKWSGTSDLLFSELLIWGFVHRLRSQRRLACAVDMLGPLSDPQCLELHGLSVKQQVKLLESLVAGTETHDPYLHDHSRRVARHAWMIAKRMGHPRAEVARIRTAASLHDVGKLETPIEILHKPGPLSDDEFTVIKRHPADGGLMAGCLRDPALTAMIRHHHERLDGSGYPDGLRGEEIPLGARIIAVADTFDAITSKRPYRPASPHKHALNILREEAGAKLDADVVRAFCGHYAGRAPIALWSSIAGLPERILSWLGSSLGSVASVAKVAAVTALVGGAALTTSKLGLPAAKRHQPDIALKAPARTPAAGPSADSARAYTVALTVPVSRHASRARARAARSTRRGLSPAVGPTMASPRPISDTQAGTHWSEGGPADEGGESRITGAGGASKGEAHTRNGPHPEAPGSGASVERAAHGKSEEAHGTSEQAHAKGEEGHGKSQEAHGKSQEAHVTTEAPPTKGEEHTKHEASTTGTAASEEPAGKSSESGAKGSSEAARSKSESAQQNSPAPR